MAKKAAVAAIASIGDALEDRAEQRDREAHLVGETKPPAVREQVFIAESQDALDFEIGTAEGCDRGAVPRWQLLLHHGRPHRLVVRIGSLQRNHHVDPEEAAANRLPSGGCTPAQVLPSRVVSSNPASGVPEGTIRSRSTLRRLSRPILTAASTRISGFHKSACPVGAGQPSLTLWV